MMQHSLMGQYSLIGQYDEYVYAITALLPLSAAMLVFQVNPYHALVIRGILGAVAALVYTVLGAADVALTEAMVGTMLAVTLYAVAVRSSMVLRLGVLKDEAIALPPLPGTSGLTPDQPSSPSDPSLKPLIDNLRATFSKHHLRLELVPYLAPEDLQQALLEKEVHATCTRLDLDDLPPLHDVTVKTTYQTTTRLRRIYDILQTDLPPSSAIAYVGPPTPGAKHP
jgi:putative multicomponent Na+:H+ antiporter subunit B